MPTLLMPTSNRSKDKLEIEIEPGLRVNIDGQWFTVTSPLNEPDKPDTWQLVGYSIPAGTLARAKKIILERTSEQIRQHMADYIAEQVLKGGFQLPEVKPKKRQHPTREFFMQRVMALRRDGAIISLSV